MNTLIDYSLLKQKIIEKYKSMDRFLNVDCGVSKQKIIDALELDATTFTDEETHKLVAHLDIPQEEIELLFFYKKKGTVATKQLENLLLKSQWNYKDIMTYFSFKQNKSIEIKKATEKKFGTCLYKKDCVAPRNVFAILGIDFEQELKKIKIALGENTESDY